MSTNIGGNPALWPVLFPIPSDGDAPNAASVNGAFVALANRTANLNEKKLAVLDVEDHYALMELGGGIASNTLWAAGSPSASDVTIFTLPELPAGKYKIGVDLEYRPSSGGFSGVASTTHTYHPLLLWSIAGGGSFKQVFDIDDSASYTGSGDNAPNNNGPLIRPVCTYTQDSAGEITFAIGFRANSTNASLQARVMDVRAKWSVYRKVA